MYLEAFSDNPYATNCWLLAAGGERRGPDRRPGLRRRQVLALLEAASKRPVAVLATHGHYDHVGSAAAVCGTELPLYIHKDDELALTDPAGVGGGLPAAGCPAGRGPDDLGRRPARGGRAGARGASHPGPHAGKRLLPDRGPVFSGDLVFRGTVGRSDFPNSDPGGDGREPAAVPAAPDELAVHPGHLQPTTVGHERATNPFLAPLA